MTKMGFLTFFKKDNGDTHPAHPDEMVEMVDSVESGEDSTAGLTPDNMPDYNDKTTKKLMRKLDFRAIGALAVIYQFSWMDRGNIVAGQNNGITQKLDMSNRQFKGALVIFFCLYALCGIPWNIMLKTWRPRTWLAIIVFLWGAVMACQGVVNDWIQIFMVRLLLGMLEAAILPAIVYILSMMYARYEVCGRLSFIFRFCSLFEPIMALAALGSHRMDGLIGNLMGWQFSFIGMGAGLAIMGLSLWVFMLPDVPDRIKFLKPHEKATIERRLAQDTGTSPGQIDLHDGPFSVSILKDVLLDWKLWLWTLMAFCAAVCIFGFGYAIHLIMSDLGYSVLDTQLLCIPLYVAGAISTWVFGWWSDRRMVRWRSLLGCFGMAGFSYLVLLTLPRSTSRWYFWGILYLVPIGSFPAFVITVVWAVNNLAPTWRRSIGIALVVCVGNAGDGLGYSIFVESQKPHYYSGYSVSLGACLVGMAGTVLLRFVLSKENKRRDTIEADEVKATYSEAQLLALGDKSPLYRYAL